MSTLLPGRLVIANFSKGVVEIPAILARPLSCWGATWYGVCRASGLERTCAEGLLFSKSHPRWTTRMHGEWTRERPTKTASHFTENEINSAKQPFAFGAAEKPSTQLTNHQRRNYESRSKGSESGDVSILSPGGVSERGGKDPSDGILWVRFQLLA
jgi:hypothetical protein